jgi:hypothetical protein
MIRLFPSIARERARCFASGMQRHAKHIAKPAELFSMLVLMVHEQRQRHPIPPRSPSGNQRGDGVCRPDIR